ncbi:hypothetical protein [Ponticaulis profundi]|uniref:Uncharacterized protein n=1 Tax=Ponticaulis profundi TaxID=2665222 RepID=A0ABW1S472_9PROT|tara:strand:+ start:151 stop:474 length:324 start_codon:yes stop_codon:yes gene_type:complete
MTDPVDPDHKATPRADGKYAGERWFGWTSHPKAGAYTFIAIAVLSALLFGADFLVHRHEYLHIAEFPVFYALFGFASFAFVVLSGWPLRKLLGRPENYYEPETSSDD